MKGNKTQIILFIGTYCLIILGLILPFSNSLTVDKINFAYRSLPSKEFNHHFETVELGIQTFLGIISLVITIILTGLMIFDKAKSGTAVFVLFIVYIFSLWAYNIINGTTFGKPIPTELLIGYKLLLFGTLLLFAIGFWKIIYIPKQTDDNMN